MTAIDNTLMPLNHLHMQIGKVIRERIRSKVYASGEKIPSERGLGQEFGVAQNTVSKALSVLTQEGLLERRVGRGTFVRKELATHKQVVGVVHFDSYEPTDINHGRHPWASAVTQGAGLVLRSDNRRLHPFTVESMKIDAYTDPLLFGELQRQSLTGLILCAGIHIDFAHHLLDMKVPFVTAGFRYPSLIDRVPAVMLNFNETVRRITIDAIARGATRVALVCGPQLTEGATHSGSADMIAGYRKALSECKTTCQPELIFPTPYTHQGCDETARKLLAMPSPPEMVICSQDLMGRGIRKHFRDADLSFPRRVRIIALTNFRNDSDGQTSATPLIKTFGMHVGQTLLDLIDGRPVLPLRLLDIDVDELEP